MQVQLTRDEIEVAVKAYIRVMFVMSVSINKISVGGSGQRITAEVEMVEYPDDPADVIPDPMRPEVTD